MAKPDDAKSIAERKKYVEAWNKTMLKIWAEQIKLLSVYDTGELYLSLKSLKVQADGRFYNITLSQSFLEYGLWQDLGTGREVPFDNGGDIGREKKRQRRKWFSSKYFSSSLNLRDYMGLSLGNEFKEMLFTTLDADKARYDSAHYKRKGYTRR